MIISVVLILGLAFNATAGAISDNSSFSDVPKNHYAYESVNGLKALGIINGFAGKFGMGEQILRRDFIKMLVSLMGWTLIHPDKPSFTDNSNKNQYYYDYIETALLHGVITNDDGKVRPNDFITREEIAVMIVRSLGYESLAQQLAYLGKPFNDVAQNIGYINIAQDIGIVTGTNSAQTVFSPNATAKREDAAVMLHRMYLRQKNKITDLHAFYAINSSPQADFIKELSSVSFGWSSIQYDNEKKAVILNTSKTNGNNYYIPSGGFSERVSLARESGVSAQLMVYASQDDKIGEIPESSGLLQYLFETPGLSEQIIDDIIKQLEDTKYKGESTYFDGVVIDFEGLKGTKLKLEFNTFLRKLKDRLGTKTLYVAVHPVEAPGNAYYDGYDYRTIGEISDKVILMAHDYYNTTLTKQEMDAGYNNTPLTPIDKIYCALKAITDKHTGVADTSKIMLQLSMDKVQWVKKDGKIINQTAYRPDYEALKQRLASGASMFYNDKLDYRWMTFYNDINGTENIIWYEDQKSIAAKVKLAKLFNIKGISLWRLGIIPDYNDPQELKFNLNVWQYIKDETEK